MPYVLLQHKVTGRGVWFFNTHNPADAHGNAQRWRDEGFAIEAPAGQRPAHRVPRHPGDHDRRQERPRGVLLPGRRRLARPPAQGGYVDQGACTRRRR
ncbi:MAG: hypothetical protein R2734_05465 [Nocardioides sp.]